MEGEQRGEFERDYGRAIFSTPVRRLHDKAQVFPLDPHDAIRTRLTHSLEVSTVARGLARRVTTWLQKKKEIDGDQADSIQEIAATCGLLHDLGNPPFGHAGEDAMRGWFRSFIEASSIESEPRLIGDFLNFEGNAQTLRIVSKLQLIADHYGLNLTCGTLSAMCKYTAAADEIEDAGSHEKSKLGFFSSESDLVDLVRDETGTGEARNPVAYLVEACDDIVYCTVDIEDGVKKGIVSWDEIEAKLMPLGGGDCVEKAKKYVDRGSLEGKVRGEAMAQMFRTFAIAKMVGAAFEAFKSNYQSIMKGAYHGELLKDSQAASLVKACKQIGRSRIYGAEEILRLEIMGRKVIHDLLCLFWEGVEEFDVETKQPARGFPEKIYSLLSDNYKAVFEEGISEEAEREGGLPEWYCKLQLIADYVCGMTDTFACTLRRRLSDF